MLVMQFKIRRQYLTLNYLHPHTNIHGAMTKQTCVGKKELICRLYRVLLLTYPAQKKMLKPTRMYVKDLPS
jgi:hypothetical protein